MLKKLFSHYLNFNAEKELITTFDASIPLPLRELYEIRALYNEAWPNNELFDTQDHLFEVEKLDLTQSPFTFLMENQGNWICQTELNNDEPVIIFDDRCGERRIIDVPLVDFLTTYALQELTFSFENISYNDWTAESIRQLYPDLKDLWINKKYVYANSCYSYYTLDNEVVFMNASGATFFGTNNTGKFESMEERINFTI